MKLLHNLCNIQRIYKAFGYSFCGIKTLMKHEIAFQQEIILTIFIVPLAFYLGEFPLTKVLLIGSWILVLIMEIVNTALEAVVDRISLERHSLSKKIKDLGSAAVLLALLNAIITWVLLLW